MILNAKNRLYLIAHYGCHTLLTAAVISFLFIFISCDSGSDVRKYTEKADTKAPLPSSSCPAGKEAHSAPPAAEPAQAASHFQWTTPDGWNQSGESSGFRLATFTINPGPKEAKCTIVPLQGEAGGLEANILRWLEQINIQMAPDSEPFKKVLASCEKFLTAGNFPATLCDLTALTTAPDANSIIVTVISVNGNSIFVKLTGEKKLLQENKEKFKALCQSFSLKPGS